MSVPNSIPKATIWGSRYVPTPSRPLINLAQGVPGTPPPHEMQHRIVEAAADPATLSYGDLEGDESLREALASDINGVYGVKRGGYGVRPDEIVITSGANLARSSAGHSVSKTLTRLVTGFLCYDDRPGPSGRRDHVRFETFSPYLFSRIS
jgi:aspartate/methionine/tyrosine aminotransferase